MITTIRIFFSLLWCAFSILLNILRFFLRFIFRFLYWFSMNWPQVDKMRMRNSMYQSGIIAQHVMHLENYEFDMEAFFKTNRDGIKKEEACQVILAFGPNCPTSTEYNRFKQFLVTSDLLPSVKELQQNLRLQESWEIAYHWAKDYEQDKDGIVLTEKEKRKAEIEQEIRVMKAKIVGYQDQIKGFELNQDKVLLAKEQKIAKLKELLAKQKLKTKQLKRKQSYKLFGGNEVEFQLENYETKYE